MTDPPARAEGDVTALRSEGLEYDQGVENMTVV